MMVCLLVPNSWFVVFGKQIKTKVNAAITHNINGLKNNKAITIFIEHSRNTHAIVCSIINFLLLVTSLLYHGLIDTYNAEISAFWLFFWTVVFNLAVKKHQIYEAELTIFCV